MIDIDELERLVEGGDTCAVANNTSEYFSIWKYIMVTYQVK